MSLIRFASRFAGQSMSSASSPLSSSSKSIGSTFFLGGCQPISIVKMHSLPETLVPAVRPNQFESGIVFNQTRKLGSLNNDHLKRQLQSSAVDNKRDSMPVPKTKHRLKTREISKNILVFAEHPEKFDFDSQTLKLKTPTGNPLVVIMSWLLATPKHLKNYADIYTSLGFDVVVVQIAPWQLLWPTNGTQQVAASVVKFLESNSHYSQIVVHGFSVGAYQFGEILYRMSQDVQRYQPIVDKIACQIWDSAADITEIPIGVPKAIFPKNQRLQNALKNYTLYHLKTFHNQATVHYMRSRQCFHSTPIKAPALILVSKNDLIGPERSNLIVKESWEAIGMKVTFKCWEHSGHVAHYIHHRDEYLSYLYKHLEEAQLIDTLAKQSRAKL